jgi:hypothetical protein
MGAAVRRDKLRWIIAFWTLAVLVGVLVLRAHLADRAPAAAPARPADAKPIAVPQEPRTFFPAARRIVAIGDLHGDLAATRAALRLAGAIDASDRWVGGDLVVVQTGDELDRGDAEREILDLFSRLEIEAAESGGAFRPLLGNHDLLNVEGDFKYVGERGLEAFDDLVQPLLRRPDLLAFPPAQRARAAAFRPGGPFAAVLARRNVVAVIGDSAFVHGGVLPEHVAYGVERLNRETRAFVRGERPALPPVMVGPTSPVWTRLYSLEPTPAAATCATLRSALAGLGAARMIVGHTIQEQGIVPACGGALFRIDVGMSAAYAQGPPAVLEIVGDRASPLTTAAPATNIQPER